MTDVIIDCDPGIDDALALALAISHPDINILGVTTVAGNRGLDQVTRNALDLLDFFGAADIPVAAGAARPLRRDHVPATVHGDSGLGGHELARSSSSARDDAAAFLVETVMTRPPHSVTIVAIGPLTNLAEALRRDPRIAQRVRQVVLMGGGRGVGNMTPVAEFNIYVDPDAADIVIPAKWPVTIIGLDLTWQAGIGPLELKTVHASTAAVAPAIAAWMDHYAHAETNPLGGGPAVHDVCAVAAVIAPELFDFRPAFVRVETDSDLTRGETIVDIDGLFAGTTNAMWATRLNRAGFWDLVFATVLAD